MAAFTELLADSGYAGVRVGDIANRAGVSNEAFYEVFSDKEDCAFAAYDRFIDVLVRRMRDGLARARAGASFLKLLLKSISALLKMTRWLRAHSKSRWMR